MRFELVDFRVTWKVHFLNSEKCTNCRLKKIISIIMYATIGKVYIFWKGISQGIQKSHCFVCGVKGKREIASRRWDFSWKNFRSSCELFVFILYPTSKKTSNLNSTELELSKNVYFYYDTCYRFSVAQTSCRYLRKCTNLFKFLM
jgi:hypothetical protein